MLPNWAQLLDLAARLCPVSVETRDWFSRFTNSAGVDDARTVAKEAGILLNALRENRQSVNFSTRKDERRWASIARCGCLGVFFGHDDPGSLNQKNMFVES